MGWDIILKEKNEDEQYARFYRQWALKESYVKAIGTGLSFSPRRLEMRHNLGHTDSISPFDDNEEEIGNDLEVSTTINNIKNENKNKNRPYANTLEGKDTGLRKGDSSIDFGNDLQQESPRSRRRFQRSKSSPSILEDRDFSLTIS